MRHGADVSLAVASPLSGAFGALEQARFRLFNSYSLGYQDASRHISVGKHKVRAQTASKRLGWGLDGSNINRVAVVTGAGRGIGKGVATSLATAGMAVAVLDVFMEGAEATAKEIQRAGGHADAYKCDVRNRDEVFECVRAVEQDLGAPNVLVNNAGIYNSSDLVSVNPGDWMDMIQVNLTGAFWCSQAIAPHLMQTSHGRIVNIASTGAKIGWEKNHAYCASKSGLLGLTRTLALELARYGATVNSVCPGNTNTDMMTSVDADICRENGWPAGQFVETVKARIPMGRLAHPGDIAELVLFLCSKQAQFITGQAINVDGGLVMY
jgi:NAD(P)-dependent dehydrogenase (short-subunit alcohol dehydrogenase family)